MSRRSASEYQPESASATRGTSSAQSQVIRAAVSDVAAVIAFSVLVGLGLGDKPADILQLLAMFVPALALAWFASRAWRNPAAMKPTGLGIWAATAMVGLAILALVNNARPTMTMATLTVVLLGVLLLGWRGLVALMERGQQT